MLAACRWPCTKCRVLSSSMRFVCRQILYGCISDCLACSRPRCNQLCLFVYSPAGSTRSACLEPGRNLFRRHPLRCVFLLSVGVEHLCRRTDSGRDVDGWIGEDLHCLRTVVPKDV